MFCPNSVSLVWRFHYCVGSLRAGRLPLCAGIVISLVQPEQSAQEATDMKVTDLLLRQNKIVELVQLCIGSFRTAHRKEGLTSHIALCVPGVRGTSLPLERLSELNDFDAVALNFKYKADALWNSEVVIDEMMTVAGLDFMADKGIWLLADIGEQCADTMQDFCECLDTLCLELNPLGLFISFVDMHEETVKSRPWRSNLAVSITQRLGYPAGPSWAVGHGKGTDGVPGQFRSEGVRVINLVMYHGH